MLGWRSRPQSNKPPPFQGLNIRIPVIIPIEGSKPPPCKGLKTRIPLIIPIKGMGFINRGSTLGMAGNRYLWARFVVVLAAQEPWFRLG